jgi:RNA polymerase sigma factor (sigma-70 family)
LLNFILLPDFENDFFRLPKTAIHNENELLLKVAADCETSFRLIFTYYQPIIYTAALRITGNSSLSEDILQDTFLKVWLKRSSLPGIKNFSGWLFTIAQNVMYDAIRASAKQRIIFRRMISEMTKIDSADTESLVQEENLENILREAVDRLPLKQRQTYTLIKVKLLTREHAAQILQVSPETVKSNLDHAMRSIRAFCLKTVEAGPPVIIFYLFF